MIHDPVDLLLFVVPLVLAAIVVAVALCVSAARGDRQMREAWDEERRRNADALKRSTALNPRSVHRHGTWN